MRVLRITAGILTLLVALPILAAGAVAWWAMQHRSPDGAFHASLMPIDSPYRVVVVPDVDALLRRDAPIARAKQTSLELNAGEGAFVAMAAPADLAAFLTGVSYTELTGARLGRGPLTVTTRHVVSAGETLPSPQQPFWVRQSSSTLKWTPTADRDRQLALIVIAPSTTVELSVAVTAAWLNNTTWGLLILGPVLLLLGFATLAWPQRPREIVYVMNTPVAADFGLPRPAVPFAPGHVPSIHEAASRSSWPAYVPILEPAQTAAQASHPPASPAQTQGAAAQSQTATRVRAAVPVEPQAEAEGERRQNAQMAAAVPARGAVSAPAGDDEAVTQELPVAGRRPGRAADFVPGFGATVAASEQDAATEDAELTIPVQPGPGGEQWPPPEPELHTEQPHLVSDDSRPMPTAGMQLHLSRK
ncbi:hypothetical protein [Catelliglobosispora koreensis]|uniref:hypothetical protein n=1 Tax=Catelliglobosispora koreensis TaxID=129052 RepID=UPI0003715D94|nr:hypothetical protein [Catelliglobosispora koreensis]